ncbi:MAG: UbiA family prenyltransferase [Alphaproteobacteria bacterium]|nr:UbiA family prenyltransferase [Alphaproteobacteria bacterium]
MAKSKPLVLDVDGTFLKTDMLLESFWYALGHDPITCLKTCATHFTNRAALKQALAAMVDLRIDLLPVNPQVAELAADSLKQGREVVFASGSDQSLVRRLAKEHGLSDTVFASDGEVNMTGSRKAAALVRAYGTGGFDYAGDGIVDKPVWQAAENAIIIGNHPQMASALAGNGGNVEEFGGGWRKRDLLRALRPHQWVKNVLLFLPLIAAHRIDMAGVLIVLAAAVAYSMAASSIYIVNDLLDLEADRLHPTKRKRPFASGTVPILVGMLASLLLGSFALGLAYVISWPMLGIVALYMALSLAYSLKLKRMRWVDVATLAGLYTLRVIAGAIAAQVLASGFLVAFIFPTFITLGCVKRLTELTLATSDENLPGRGYGRRDRGDLLNVAGLGTFGALLVFFLYSFTDAAAALYANIWMLWLALIPIGAWLVRMVVLGWQGKQDYDPIVFAMRDKIGLAIIAVILAILFTAAG